MKFIPTILPLLLVASTTADLNTRSDRKLGGGVGGKSSSSARTRMAMADEEVDVADLHKDKNNDSGGDVKQDWYCCVHVVFIYWCYIHMMIEWWWVVFSRFCASV